MKLRRNPWFSFLVCLFVIFVAFLVGPRIPDDEQVATCAVNVRLPGPFGLSLFCDFSEFMRLATNPAAVLEPENTRQSRPGFIFAAALVTLPLSPLRGLASHFGVNVGGVGMDRGKVANALESWPPAFMAYVFLNILLLVGAFGCLMKICTPNGNSVETLIMVAAGLLLLANNVVFWVWSPHTNLFNVLVPVLSVYAALQAWFDRLRDRRFAVAMGAVTGFGFTAYALFAVLVPCLALPALARSLRLPWKEARVRLVNLAIVVALSVLPYAAWFLFVRLKTGGFHSEEVSGYRQVVWMQDAWVRGAAVLATLFARKAVLLIKLAAPQAIAAAVMIAWVLAIAIFGGAREQLRPTLQVLGVGLFVSALIALFYAAVGFIVARLAYAIVPPLIAIAAFAGIHSVKQSSSRRAWLLAVGFLVIAIVHTLVTVLGPPPYNPTISSGLEFRT